MILDTFFAEHWIKIPFTVGQGCGFQLGWSGAGF
jgi:hypothetical protein